MGASYVGQREMFYQFLSRILGRQYGELQVASHLLQRGGDGGHQSGESRPVLGISFPAHHHQLILDITHKTLSPNISHVECLN